MNWNDTGTFLAALAAVAAVYGIGRAVNRRVSRRDDHSAEIRRRSAELRDEAEAEHAPWPYPPSPALARKDLEQHLDCDFRRCGRKAAAWDTREMESIR